MLCSDMKQCVCYGVVYMAIKNPRRSGGLWLPDADTVRPDSATSGP